MSLTGSLGSNNTVLTISVDGRFDFNLHKDFREIYRSYSQNADIKEYVIDLSETKYMDSSALGMLLLLREYAGGDGGHIRITGCNPEIREILEISNFDRLFTIN